MLKEDFKIDSYGDYEINVYDVLIKIWNDSLNEVTIKFADNVLKWYLLNKCEIIDFIIHDRLLSFYEGYYSIEMIKEKLNDPFIELMNEKSGNIVWVNHELDGEHIIEVEFDKNLQLLYTKING